MWLITNIGFTKMLIISVRYLTAHSVCTGNGSSHAMQVRFKKYSNIE